MFNPKLKQIFTEGTMQHKIYRSENVLEAAQCRVSEAFDNFEKIFVSFSGGKDSSVMLHLALDEAIKRGRKIGVLIIDFEAQYKRTADHIQEMLELYEAHIEPYWVCLPIKLRNASSNFEPVWTAWDPDRKDDWVREMPKHSGVISDPKYFDWFQPNMEFEEFIVLFADWYAGDGIAAAFVGIRADESLNRFRTICTFNKETWAGRRWTTKVTDSAYNIYPVYDWATKDIWKYHSVFPDRPHNAIYDLMHQAGVKPSQQRLCQPYGDDQRRGLWLYHLLEPETWYKVVARVNGVNSGALYIQERGNVNGYNKITLPEGHNYESFCKLLLQTMPKVTRDHFIGRFKGFIKGWKRRGYTDGIPDFAPKVLEDAQWAPSYRRLCKVLLRNDWWCKGLGMTQPKSDAYARYMDIKKLKKAAP
jgi:predicted phosphoadenosine phosphosulfate sulfurtransferase